MTVVGKFQGDVVRAVSSFERTSVPDPVLIRSSVVAVHFSQNILCWVGNFHGEVSPPLQHPEIVDGHDLLFSFRLSTFITRERIQQKLYKYLDLQCKIFFIFDPLTGVYAKKPHCKKKFPDQNLAIYENKILKTNIFFVKMNFFKARELKNSCLPVLH